MARSEDETASTSDGPPRPRAADVARAIEDEIVAAGWRVGEALGSETSLMARFEVGRSVIREACRILESRHVAKPRRGPGGGLVVTAPERSAVLDHASLYLEYAGFAAADLFETMETLETAAAAQLSATIDPAGVDRLRQVLAEESRSDDLRAQAVTVHTEIARLTGNPVLELFMHIGNNLARIHGVSPTEAERRWIHERNVELVDAIIAGDALAAQRNVRRRIRAMTRRQAVSADRTPTFTDTEAEATSDDRQ
ncbi:MULTISPECIES: FadR/GntR family transcriptional regulator [unclassified Rhodococcus (in: high G+C Gram-positive bacteria)]|uniref:FadR/GntR family transcriptional regulator n=1 Tax=unclassified Rhodococcus (in: high G+C Gram-positive bacteria) TaxID=192944 RepID=UPI001ED9365F|nr:FCD domain-containing protein [Rhodococcus sp. DK17]